MKPITERRAKQIDGVTPDTIPYDELFEASEPVVLKGLVRDWGLVQAGLRSDSDAIGYLKTFYNGKTVGAYYAGPDIGGRYFYNADVSGMNFERGRDPLDQILDDIKDHLPDETPPSIYVGSTTVDACLPGMRQENDLAFNHPMFEANPPLCSIWLGNPSLISAHYDAPNNIACCSVGKRRFTLFPPEQIHNLYPGPLEPTPGGQAISMVDFADPDYQRYPRFKRAVEAAQVADLEPGDALFYPSMWWHQVESFSPFNAMINYWWNTSPKYMGTPMNVLKHALLGLRDRPEHEKHAWREVFDYYVFGPSDTPRQHLPENAWGELGPMDDIQSRKLRAFLINRLNR